MNISFNSNIANALVNGHPIPTPFVHQFVQEAYDTFQYAQKAFTSNKDYESNIRHLEDEMSVVKANLLDCEEELKEAKENARIAQEQRNASDRKIEELQNDLHALKEEQKKRDEYYVSAKCSH